MSIGTTLLNPSKLVILDEPTAGIDPETRHYVWSLLNSVRIEGRALLLSSHSIEECEALCSRIAVLVQGRLVAIGESQLLKSKYAYNLYPHVILMTAEDREMITNEVTSTFPSSILLTKRKDSHSLKFKICRGQRDRVSALYRKAQEMASKLPLKDFFLLQGSLEDVLEELNKLHGGRILQSD